MEPRGRAARLILAVSAALLVAYAVIWAQVSSADIGRSDFTAFYMGGTLLREGHRADLYDEAVQAPLHSQLIAPDREGNLPFVDAPVAAVLVLPATYLGLDAAYRLWGLLELGVLAIAVVVAVRAAPWPDGVPRSWRWAAGAMALAGAGTWAVWAQAQWAPLLALGLAVAYSCWRRGHLATGAAALVASAAVGKPQLALGLLAFMLGWRERRVILGALAGAAGVALVSLAIVGPAGMGGFIAIVAGSAARWNLRLMSSIVGLAGSYLGNGPAAHAAAAAGSLAACVAAFWLGSRVRRDQRALPLALTGAAVLSLLAAPHAYLHDLAMLAPVAVLAVAAAAAPAFRRAGAMAPVAGVLGAWVLINIAAVIDLTDGGAFPPGQLTAPALIVTAACACVAAHRLGAGDASAPIRYRAAREAAVGAVAHGLRGR